MLEEFRRCGPVSRLTTPTGLHDRREDLRTTVIDGGSIALLGAADDDLEVDLVVELDVGSDVLFAEGAGDQLPEHDGEAEDVALFCVFLAKVHLWRCVGVRASELAQRAVVTRLGRYPRQSKITHFHDIVPVHLFFFPPSHITSKRDESQDKKRER